jgi:hypothetical protein
MLKHQDFLDSSSHESHLLSRATAIKRACLVCNVEPIGAGISSMLNIIGIFSVADETFSHHFGITHKDVFAFLNHNADLTAQIM